MPLNLKEKLYNAVLKEVKNGNIDFTIGTHGDFDKLALDVCQTIKQQYNHIEINVAVTSFNQLEKYKLLNKYSGIAKINTIMYNIENVYYKGKIIDSNKQTIKNSNILICYIYPHYLNSGAVMAYKNAKKCGLKIINLYSENF